MQFHMFLIVIGPCTHGYISRKQSENGKLRIPCNVLKDGKISSFIQWEDIYAIVKGRSFMLVEGIINRSGQQN